MDIENKLGRHGVKRQKEMKNWNVSTAIGLLT